MQEAELADLLTKTSRTFALAIPLLPVALARRVGVAYLLFRIADTFEDGELWNREERVAGLTGFLAWLDGGAPFASPTQATADQGCLELLERSSEVLASLDEVARGPVIHHVRHTAERMRAFVERQGKAGEIVLADVPDLQAYCYAVAGIVGELLTDLFLLASPSLQAVEPDLRARAATFGEGLQLVNILKDAPSDAKEGRRYMPEGVPRADVMRLAKSDLGAAEAYVAALRHGQAPQGLIAFCELPLRLAVATLDRLAEGAAKLTRDEVAAIVASVST